MMNAADSNVGMIMDACNLLIGGLGGDSVLKQSYIEHGNHVKRNAQLPKYGR